MDSIKKTVLDIKRKAHNEEEFIKGINDLINTEGDAVCQTFFKIFAELDLPPYTARRDWFNVIDHHESLSTYLGRDVDLLTVVSDYLNYSCQYFKNPKIVEFDTYEKALEDARHDTLTGLLNRGCFWEMLNSQIAQAKRHGTELALLFADVDDFKLFNDTYGHQAGDKALVAIAHVIRQESRTDDVAIRYGGEEFVVIMPNTSEEEALVLAERIRDKIASSVIDVDGHDHSPTISGGIATYPVDSNDGQALLNMADRALYRAKAMGKNNIAIFTDKKQRTSVRCQIVRPIKIKQLGVDSMPLLDGASKNICMNGMLFETKQQLDIGSNIEVSIPIMNSQPLFLLGSVVRVSPEGNGRYDTGMAISFKEMEKTAREEISNFLMLVRGGSHRGARRRFMPDVSKHVEM